MKAKEYANFKEAIESLTVEDGEYIFLRHSLKAGERVPNHSHPKANEWILINHGKCVLTRADSDLEISLRKRVMSFLIPKGVEHTLLAVSNIHYFVLRDKEDKSI